MLEGNCPESQRGPVTGATDQYWGGRNPEINHPDQKVWVDRMGAKGWTTKAKICEVVEIVTNESIQMHGGIGMTDEFEIGFFIKRARAVQATFGGYSYHSDRFARLSGY
jgi:alkylation response protein AidB-like acyl-CoA dehydrogenase